MATLAEIEASIKRKTVDAELESRKSSGLPLITAREQTAINQGPFDTLAIQAGAGLKNISNALGFTDSSEFEKQAIKALSEESPIASEIGQIAGETLPFLPAGVGAASIKAIAPRVAASTVVGGAEGGLIARGRGGNLSEQIKGAGIGGSIQGGVEILFPIISRIGGALSSKVTGKKINKVIDSSGNPTPEFQAVLDKSGVTFNDLTETAQGLATAKAGGNPAQVERKAFIESQGVNPTQAQVTRSADDFQAQQELAKTSTSVRRALEGQEAKIIDRFDNATIATKGNPEPSGSPVFDTIQSRSLDLDNEISNLYSLARDRAKETGKTVRLIKFKNLLGKSKTDDAATKGLITSTIGDLESRGIIKGDSLKSISIEDAEKVRSRLNQLFNSTSDFGRSKIRDLKQALDDDVLGQSGGDIFKKARDAKSKFEKDLSRVRIGKFDKNKKSVVRDILENKISPDEVTEKLIFSKATKPDDLQGLKRYLTSGTKAQRQEGVRAWQDLRAETLRNIRDIAFSGAKDEFGNRAMTEAGLKKALNRIGKSKLNILFRAQEQKFFKDLTRLAELRTPVRGTVMGLGPSAQAIGILNNTISKIPLLGTFIEGVTINKAGKAVLNPNPKKAIKETNGRSKDLLLLPAQASVPLLIQQDTTQ